MQPDLSTIVAESRQRQGLPPVVTDVAALTRVSALLTLPDDNGGECGDAA